MGRKRSIDRESLMQAVESVARRSGVAGLSIDAVAKEANISKSSVIYDCESKSGLLASFTQHRIAHQRGKFEAALARHEGTPNAWLRAMLDVFRTAPTDDDIAMALLISVGTGESAECREIMRDVLRVDADRVAAEAANPRKMLQVFLTLHGMACMEYFGFLKFDDATRNEILDDLIAISISDTGARADP